MADQDFHRGPLPESCRLVLIQCPVLASQCNRVAVRVSHSLDPFWALRRLNIFQYAQQHVLVAQLLSKKKHCWEMHALIRPPFFRAACRHESVERAWHLSLVNQFRPHARGCSTHLLPRSPRNLRSHSNQHRIVEQCRMASQSAKKRQALAASRRARGGMVERGGVRRQQL